MPPWEEIALQKRKFKAARIPSNWRLAPHLLDHTCDLLSLPRRSNILTGRELKITEKYDAVDLATAIREKRYTAYEVTVAFCKASSREFKV